MSIPDGETSIKRRTAGLVIRCAVIWVICWYRDDLLTGIACTCGAILLFLANRLPVSVKRYLPKPIETWSLRFWLMIMALSAMILSGHLFSFPLLWKSYLTLAGLLLAVVAWFFPFPERHIRSSPPPDSLHTSN